MLYATEYNLENTRSKQKVYQRIWRIVKLDLRFPSP